LLFSRSKDLGSLRKHFGGRYRLPVLPVADSDGAYDEHRECKRSFLDVSGCGLRIQDQAPEPSLGQPHSLSMMLII
jgi:hypothetical protein